MADRNRNEYQDQQRRWRGQDNDWDYDPDQDRDWQNNRDDNRKGDFDRTRQWRGQTNDQNNYDRRFDRNYGRDPNFNRDRNSDFGWDHLDRNVNYGQNYNRQTEGGEIYNRGWYNWDYDQDFNDINEYDRDRDFSSNRAQVYDRNPNQGRSNRGQGQQRGQNQRYPFQRGTGGMGSDYRDDYQSNNRGGPGGYENRGQYRSAGMNSDYGSAGGYDNRDQYDRSPNYRRGDVGYDSEGAFYQDMDEAQNYERWDLPGMYTGMGPANYQRKDERIQDEISERLTRHGRVDASNIEIEVNNGEVTLRGSLPDREMKRLAEDVAENITGVKDIHNQIRVQKQGSEQYRQTGYDRNYNRDTGQSWESKWPSGAENSMAGQTNAGAGLTDAGATSLSGMEAVTAVENKKRQIREGMEVVDKQGKVVGRVKTIREGDFLVDRELARDIYVPLDHVQSVGAQILLDVAADAIDQQGWEKPKIL